jgi:hypothetical protein
LQSAVHQSRLMHRVQRGGDLSRKIEQVPPMQTFPAQKRIERLSLHQLADDEVLSVSAHQLKWTRQIRMGHPGGGGDGFLNPATTLGVRCDLGRQGIDRDQAARFGIPGLVNRARRINTEARQNFIVQQLANHSA